MSLTERIEMRLSERDKEAIVQAAALERSSTTEFMRNAVLDRVRVVQARSERTLMPADQFDRLIAALDDGDEAPNLARAFARARPFIQH